MKKNYFIVSFLLMIALTFLSGCELSELTTTTKEVETESTTTTEEVVTEYTTTNLDDVLTEEYLNTLAESKIDADASDYIIFIYSPYCNHCHQVLTSSEYENFVSNPKIKLYLINTVDITDVFLEKTKVDAVPTMINIEKQSDESYHVSIKVGYTDCIELLVTHTLTNE
ncbi:hypothetical protein KHQ81_11155 [Mycoplasmatota bacterium]|nr:hypothetical protein KHQ81_11155 [Mycoplasmatota bacterium]